MLDLAAHERAGFLSDLGRRDPRLQAAVEAFLAESDRAGDFLAAPVDARATALLRAIGADDRSWDALQTEGAAIGPYRVIRELGRGGMGAVFLAERTQGGFEQRVALKLVKRGMDTTEILERFRAERQILARLDHPNVARLLDGGISESGQPYFAMEYVDGTPLTTSCDAAALSIPDRLRLFHQVCEAVEYAHRNLVVHRDLKPSNVLVTPGGQVKLLDFGIAKVLDPALAGGPVTSDEARPMTPRYAAPELLRGEPVTTAADVYSLGVILYELLAGRHPYRGRGSGRAEIEAALREGEIEPPSAAVHRVEPAEPNAPPAPSPDEQARARGGLTADRLGARLRGDLDNVVGMALRREPARRYASVAALADDLRRFLEGRPVQARGDRFAYRASKFVRRHRTGVAAAVLLAVFALAGVAATLIQAREAMRQASRAEELKRFAFSLFELADPDAAKGREITARELLERGSARADAELAGQPALQAELLLFLGTIHHHLGLDRQSVPLLERALALRREHLAGDPLAVSEAELALASVQMSLGELAQAEELRRHALEVRRVRLGDTHPLTAAARGQLGRVVFEKGDLEGAERLLREAIAAERAQPGSAEELAVNLNALGLVRHARGYVHDAEPLYREALELRRRLYGPDHSRVIESVYNLASVMQERGDFRGAESLFREVLARHRQLLGRTHEFVANDLNNLAMTLVTKGDFPEAESLLRESLAIRRTIHGAESPQQAITVHNLAQVLRWQGRLEEAEPLSLRAIRLGTGMLGEDHVNIAIFRQELAQILWRRARFAEAEALARQALVVYRMQLGPDHPRLAAGLVALGQALSAGRRPDEASPVFEEALRLRTLRFGEDDARTAEAHLLLGECLLTLGKRAEAGPHLQTARRTLEARLGAEHPLTRQADAAEVHLSRALADTETAR